VLADLNAPRYERISGRHAHADVALGGGKLVAREISLDLAAGRIAFNGSIPANAKPPFIDRRNAPLAARLLAQQVDLGQFASLLPQGTKLGGIVDGDVAVSGTWHDPVLHGGAGLAKGTFVSPLIASEVRDATLRLGFAGHGATVQTLHADVGGGAVDGSGAASIGDLSAPAQTLAFRLDTTEKNVGLDVPRYFRGKVDGTLSLSRDAGAPVLVAGKLDFSHTRIPLSALLPSNAAKTPSAAPLPIAFDLTVAATNDDRLQSPNVDIGAKGSAVLGGTLAKPTLDGSFDATDGTVSLYRSFTLQKAHVAFDPSAGIIPDVDVTATTQVPNPPTDVLLHAHGPATGLALDLSSRPSYDKAQIVGLLVNAQALGAVSGVASTSPSDGGGSNLLRSTAVGYVDQQFTRGLFEPFSSSVGKSLGFSTLSLNTGLSGGFSASATRNLGSKLSASFAQSTNPQSGQRQSAGLAYNASAVSAVQLTLFDAGTGGRTIGVGTPFAPTGPINFQLEALAPPPGSSGYVMTYVRKF
jgi:autotransporter translocation and assembly factor TamB